ncbi:hypothetical protein GBA52_005954 [Prunus armeniaca]|nr:hypothetical protein GBA52_005954 [Prunus armeniaca]
MHAVRQKKKGTYIKGDRLPYEEGKPFALCPLPFALFPLPFALFPLPFASVVKKNALGKRPKSNSGFGRNL